MNRTVVQVTLRTALFALSHSLLASNTVKDGAEKVLGRRFRDGLYRFLYNNITFISVGLLFWSFSKLPDKVLYRVPRPISWVMRLGQLFGLWLILDTNRRMGVARFTGMAGAWEFFTGKTPKREAPAQGPLVEQGNEYTLGGAFTYSRHPNNLGPTLLALLEPRITVRSLTFAVVGSLYSFFGSMLEERRVRSEYGASYEPYRARTPYFFPVRFGGDKHRTRG